MSSIKEMVEQAMMGRGIHHNRCGFFEVAAIVLVSLNDAFQQMVTMSGLGDCHPIERFEVLRQTLAAD